MKYKTKLFVIMINIITLNILHSQVLSDLTIGISGKITTFDPTDHRDRDTQMVLRNIFDSLTIRAKGRTVSPKLAESWSVLDELNWRFTLKRGVIFHNGDPLTSKDVQFTFDRILNEGSIDGKSSSRRSLFTRISQITVVDDYTFIIKTRVPWPDLPLFLTTQGILPSEYMKEVGIERFQKVPVGSGPYQFYRTDFQGNLVVNRFEEYFGNKGIAPADVVTFRVIEDQTHRIAWLKRGLIDIATDIPVESLAIFNTIEEISYVQYKPSRSYFAFLNCSIPPFDNLSARIAANYAVDIPMLLQNMYKSSGNALTTILPEESKYFNSELRNYPHDPESAKQLLKEINLAEELTIHIYSTEQNRQFAGMISLFISKLGISTDINIGSKGEVIEAMEENKAHILVGSWNNPTLDPSEILLPLLSTGGIGNYSHYSNEHLDHLFLEADNAVSTESRRSYFNEIQSEIAEDAPMIFGYTALEYIGISQKVSRIIPSSVGMLYLLDIEVK